MPSTMEMVEQYEARWKRWERLKKNLHKILVVDGVVLGGSIGATAVEAVEGIEPGALTNITFGTFMASAAVYMAGTLTRPLAARRSESNEKLAVKTLRAGFEAITSGQEFSDLRYYYGEYPENLE